MGRITTRNAVRKLASAYSIEVTPNAAKKISDFGNVKGLRAGTSVNVTYLVGADIEDSVATCEKLALADMRPVAHVPARAFRTIDDVDDYLARLRGVGVDEVLLLGGGAPEPVGSLSETMQLLESGIVTKHGFSLIGVAAHPEGNPDIDEASLTDAIVRKAEWAAAEGVALYYETQFCFEPAPIVAWEQGTRALLRAKLGPDAKLPTVRLGVAGPAKISNLIKFGTMSGVGNSLRFFTKYSSNVLKLASKAAPDELVLGVAEHVAAEPDCMIEGLHYYPFGGFASTLKWANAVEAGDFDARSDGFDVR